MTDVLGYGRIKISYIPSTIFFPYYIFFTQIRILINSYQDPKESFFFVSLLHFSIDLAITNGLLVVRVDLSKAHIHRDINIYISSPLAVTVQRFEAKIEKERV